MTRSLALFFLALLIVARLCDATDPKRGWIPPTISNEPPDGRVLATYAPKPEYPLLPNGKFPEGSGMFLLRIDQKTGIVKSVSVEKSTGSAILDKTTVDCLKRWRFIRNAGVSKVKVPFTYTATGMFY